MLMPDTIKTSAKKFWKNFLPAWSVPVVMMGDTIRKDIFGTEPSKFFVNAVFVLFGVSFVCWVWLPITQKIRRLHAVILGMLAPFALWGVLVFCRIVALYTVDAI